MVLITIRTMTMDLLIIHTTILSQETITTTNTTISAVIWEAIRQVVHSRGHTHQPHHHSHQTREQPCQEYLNCHGLPQSNGRRRFDYDDEEYQPRHNAYNYHGDRGFAHHSHWQPHYHHHDHQYGHHHDHQHDRQHNHGHAHAYPHTSQRHSGSMFAPAGSDVGVSDHHGFNGRRQPKDDEYMMSGARQDSPAATGSLWLMSLVWRKTPWLVRLEPTVDL